MKKTLRFPQPLPKAMQIIVDFGLDVQTYLAVVDREGVGGLKIPEGSLRCPICEESHRLRGHGSYTRNVVTEGESVLTRIVRLLCSRTGRTVSVLPHFLAPRKQHTWDVIGTYLELRHIQGLTKVAAMEAATQIQPTRQKGSYWTQCLEHGATRIQSYLSLMAPRVLSLPTASALVEALAGDHLSMGEALCLHNRRIHKRLGIWLL